MNVFNVRQSRIHRPRARPRSLLQEYFHNATTNQTTWDRPTAPAAPKAAPPLPSKPSGEMGEGSKPVRLAQMRYLHVRVSMIRIFRLLLDCR